MNPVLKQKIMNRAIQSGIGAVTGGAAGYGISRYKTKDADMTDDEKKRKGIKGAIKGAIIGSALLPGAAEVGSKINNAISSRRTQPSFNKNTGPTPVPLLNAAPSSTEQKQKSSFKYNADSAKKPRVNNSSKSEFDDFGININDMQTKSDWKKAKRNTIKKYHPDLATKNGFSPEYASERMKAFNELSKMYENSLSYERLAFIRDDMFKKAYADILYGFEK